MTKKDKDQGLPFMSNVSDGIDIAKRFWGLTGLPTLPTPAGVAQFAQRLPQALPSMITPTLDVDELDKRIADMRAVEQWLDLNMTMLRTTIQSLEVQRNTIAALKAFGGAMLSASAAATSPPDQSRSTDAPDAIAALREAAAVQAEAAAAAAAAQDIESASKPQATSRKTTEPAAPAAGALPLNPVAWWGALQEQFGNIAASAAAEAQAAARRGAAKAAPAAKRSKSTRASTAAKPPAGSDTGPASGSAAVVKTKPRRRARKRAAQ